MGKFSILTYNVLFNKATPHLKKIVTTYKPDILCLQEVDTNSDNLNKLEEFNYKLADYSNSFIKYGMIFGVATYFNAHKLRLTKSDSLNLPKSIYEILLTIIRILRGGNKPRTTLRTDFQLRSDGRIIIVHNVHLTTLATNHVKVKQLEKALNYEVLQKKAPIIITGDFNYLPYQRKALEQLMQEYNLKEATKNINYTYIGELDKKKTEYNFLQLILARIAKKFYTNRLKMDYTFFKGLKLIKTERIEVDFSDHYPIISYFNL